jgi:hypothetical protein
VYIQVSHYGLLFLLAYIHCTKGFHCDISICGYNVLCSNSPPVLSFLIIKVLMLSALIMDGLENLFMFPLIFVSVYVWHIKFLYVLVFYSDASVDLSLHSHTSTKLF